MKNKKTFEMHLDDTRKKYALAQINFEKGIKGFLRKVNYRRYLLDVLENGEFLRARSSYYSCLNDWRKKKMREFEKIFGKKGSRLVWHLAVVTIFDEVKKLRRVKEQELRSIGLTGIFRSKLEDWREASVNFKMIFGFFLSVFSFFLSILPLSFYPLLQIVILASGVAIFLEGVQQRISRSKALKKGMNRLEAFRRAKDKLPQKSVRLISKLKDVHVFLEDQLLRIRTYEKKIEVKRYAIALLVGVLCGAIPVIMIDINLAIAHGVASLFSRLLCFVFPYRVAGNKLMEFFKYASPDIREFSVGEGSDGLEAFIEQSRKFI